MRAYLSALCPGKSPSLGRPSLRTDIMLSTPPFFEEPYGVEDVVTAVCKSFPE
jgi:hypothetical protein